VDSYRLLKRREKIIDKERKAGSMVQMSVAQHDVADTCPVLIGSCHSEASGIESDSVIHNIARQVLPGGGSAGL
jgi:hypothetical protein